MKYSAILDSSIFIKGHIATAGSKMLGNFIAPFDAAVVERLNAADVRIVGQIESSEFGVGGLFCETDDAGGFDDVCESDEVGGFDETGNAIRLIAADEADFALFNDYTGTVSRAAAANGLYYLHPTYGTVSRYGLIPAVTSMDQIGVLCKSPEVGFAALGIIAGYDSRDGVMLPDKASANDVQRPSLSFEVDVIALETDYSKVYSQVMQILCSAELSNNISRYDGIKYGYRAKEYNGLNELYLRSRTEAFGFDVKLAAILGAMVLSQENYVRYYDKAMRLRRLIKDSFDFHMYDVIVTKCPFLSRLCGLPSLTTSTYVYIANTGCENVLAAVSKTVKGEKL